jgi:hypothetical protein
MSNGLAGTENLLGWQLFYAPLRLAGAHVATSYNVALLASFIISGIGCAALARRLGATAPGSVIAGFVFAFNPFHVDHAIHIQTMAICWSPIAILGLDMALEKSSIRGLALLFAGFVWTFLSGMYFGIFLSIVLVLYVLAALIFGRYPFNLRALATIAVTMILAGAILSPLFLHYLDFAKSFGAYPHSKAELSSASLPLNAVFHTPAWLSSWSRTLLATSTPDRFVAAFPGVVALGLAIVGTIYSRQRQETRAAVPILFAIGGICFLLALGPSVEIRPGVISGWLTSLPLPGKLWSAISAIRWPMRIFMYAILAGSVLAGLGASVLLTRLPAEWRRAATGVIVVILLAELWPAQWFTTRSQEIVDPMKMSDAYSFLAAERDRGGVAELPNNTDSGKATPFGTRYAFGSSGHHRGVVAVHGSLLPPLLDTLRIESYRLPAPDAIKMMQSYGVTRLVIHKDLMSVPSADSIARALRSEGYTPIFETTASTVFELRLK